MLPFFCISGKKDAIIYLVFKKIIFLKNVFNCPNKLRPQKADADDFKMSNRSYQPKENASKIKRG